MKAIRLKTEFLTDPIGMDIEKPRLFWNCEGGIKQTAYEIIASDDKGNSLWNSGRTESGAMRCVWGGEAVAPKTKVIWRLRLWDETDTCGGWSEATFETGIDSWKAKWITGNYRVRKSKRYPVDCFRRRFDAADIAKARLYITACGLYEAKLNGQKCGSFVMAPGHTDYRKRVQYQTIDVTQLLADGANELTVQLADGWYRGSCGAWGLKNQYGSQTKLLAQLEITHTDGSTQTVVTDENWDWSNDGPIRFADNKDGEVVNANDVPSYKGKAKVTTHKIIPTASNNVPVVEREHFRAEKRITPSGKTVLDFGQNIAGYVSFCVNAKKGQKLKLLFGEMLHSSGEFTQENIQLKMKEKVTPLQQVIYTCKEGINKYKTTFAVFGFRYALVEADFEIHAGDFTAIAVYSNLEQTGFFDCSHPLINGLVGATLWSAKGNHLDVPTDCPTRERHGWSGDAQIFCSTANYLFDFHTFADKYLRDMYDWQKANGKLPQIAPEGGVDFYMKFMDGAVGWADAGVVIPYNLWKQYGDPGILHKYIDGMRQYAAFMQRRCGKWYPTAKFTGLHGKERKYLSNFGQAYGEWAEPADVHTTTWKDCSVPHPETATAYTAYIMDLMTEIETELGCTENAKAYASFAEGCRRSYQALRQTKGYPLDTDRQAQLVRPLYFHMLSEEQTEYAKKRLIRVLENYGWKLGTGFLSTPLILDVLAEIDIEAAYKLLENEQIPGWLSMPRLGATTIWENWDGPYNTQGAGLGSLNHYSKGSVCRWLFDTMCGIRVDGENRFVVAPRPGGSLTRASASYHSIYGKVESKWEKADTGYACTVTVPANCEALVRLPDGSAQLQTTGTVTYRMEG